jgi:hypothetical protein
MKLALILVALMLIGVASAGLEHAKVNGFNVSFDLSQTHDVVVDSGNGVNGTLTVRTFDGALTTSLIRYSKPYSVNSTWVQDDLVALFKLGAPAEQIGIDKNQGVFIISMSKDTGKPVYGALYYPDLKAGKANTFVSVTSTLPFYTTADLLRTMHVAV